MKRPMFYGIIVLLVGFITVAWASIPRMVATWTPNVEPDVVGYNLYMTTNLSNFCLDGLTTGQIKLRMNEWKDQGLLIQQIGGREVDTFNIDVPLEGTIYHFAIAALDGSNQESIPALVSSKSGDYPPSTPLDFSVVAE